MAKKQTSKRESTYGSQLPVDLSNLTRLDLETMFSALQELDDRTRYNKLSYVFPEDGPLSRHAYAKHINLMNQSANYSELLLVGANQVGKSFSACAYTAMHITGIYPDWYTGKRLIGDITVWVCSLTAQRVRDNMQVYLLGEMSDIGSGFIPRDQIVKVSPKHGVTNAVDTLITKRADGGTCKTVFKSYDQGQRAFQGDRIDLIVNDEEPEKANIYSEQLMRTVTTNGLMLTVFTPNRGFSEVVLRFLHNGKFPVDHVPEHNKHIYIENITWDDAPHLSEESKERILAGLLPHEIEARTRGIPSIGSGRVYPIAQSVFVVPPIKIPEHWPKVYGLDVGFGCTAAVWAALDIDTYGEEDPIVYIYNEYYSERQHPDVHAANILRNGKWIPGVIDPSANRDKLAKKDLMREYCELGLDVTNANNTIEPGILKTTNMILAGRLKVVSTCINLLTEYDMYAYDDEGKIKDKQKDHALDAMRYVIMSGLQRAITRPREDDYRRTTYFDTSGRSPRTGY